MPSVSVSVTVSTLRPIFLVSVLVLSLRLEDSKSRSRNWDFKIHSLGLNVETWIWSVSVSMLRLGFCQSRYRSRKSNPDRATHCFDVLFWCPLVLFSKTVLSKQYFYQAVHTPQTISKWSAFPRFLVQSRQINFQDWLFRITSKNFCKGNIWARVQGIGINLRPRSEKNHNFHKNASILINKVTFFLWNIFLKKRGCFHFKKIRSSYMLFLSWLWN